MIVTDAGEKEIEANDEYIKKSILDPKTELEKGYNKGLMQSYTDKISAEDLDKIVEYFKTTVETK
jgi:cytochrome c oxidase subunit 2